MGTAAEDVPAEGGAEVRFCANGGHVLDFLSCARHERVQLAVKDARTAMLLTDGDDHVAVVLLMKG